MVTHLDIRPQRFKKSKLSFFLSAWNVVKILRSKMVAKMVSNSLGAVLYQGYFDLTLAFLLMAHSREYIKAHRSQVDEFSEEGEERVDGFALICEFVMSFMAKNDQIEWMQEHVVSTFNSCLSEEVTAQDVLEKVGNSNFKGFFMSEVESYLFLTGEEWGVDDYRLINHSLEDFRTMAIQVLTPTDLSGLEEEVDYNGDI